MAYTYTKLKMSIMYVGDVCVCVHKKTGGERLYTVPTTMLSCHHFEANVRDGKAETPEGQSRCCW